MNTTCCWTSRAAWSRRSPSTGTSWKIRTSSKSVSFNYQCYCVSKAVAHGSCYIIQFWNGFTNAYFLFLYPGLKYQVIKVLLLQFGLSVSGIVVNAVKCFCLIESLSLSLSLCFRWNCQHQHRWNNNHNNQEDTAYLLNAKCTPQCFMRQHLDKHIHLVLNAS